MLLGQESVLEAGLGEQEEEEGERAQLNPENLHREPS